jgi:hypothetical protein
VAFFFVLFKPILRTRSYSLSFSSQHQNLVMTLAPCLSLVLAFVLRKSAFLAFVPRCQARSIVLASSSDSSSRNSRFTDSPTRYAVSGGTVLGFAKRPQPFLLLGCSSTSVAVVDFKFVDIYFSAWCEVARSITKLAYDQGLLAFDKVSEFDSEQLARCTGRSRAALIFGGKVRERTVCTEKPFGYYASRPSIFEEIPQAVASEASRLELIKP